MPRPIKHCRNKEEEERIIKIYRDNIKVQLKKRGMTYKELSAKLMVNVHYFRLLSNPSLANMVRVATAIGCKFTDLTKGI